MFAQSQTYQTARASVFGAWITICVALSLLLLVTSASGPAAAYPQAVSMAPNQAAADTLIQNSYANWKGVYVTSSGAGGFLRVRRPGDGDDTVSEGIGYGMILAANVQDKATFDGLWGYAKSHLDNNGLMNWKIGPDGSTWGSNAATDADEDMALALIAADQAWGGYGADAHQILGRILQFEVESGSNVLKPGDVWGGSDVTNPSYFAPGYYKVFASYTGETRWNQVADATYRVVAALNAKTGSGMTGLLPDWTRASGDPASGMGSNYTYDACRSPWRLAVDAAWFGEPRATSQLNHLNAFWAGIGPANIKDGYTLSGSLIGQWHNSAFVAMAASGAIASTDAAYKNAMWNETVAQSPSQGYYHDTLRLLALLFMSGHMPNPLDGGTSTQPGGGTTQPATGAGYIQQEVWTNVSGTTVSLIPVGRAADQTRTLTSLEMPVNWADSYGTRIRGYLIAPTTGQYTFWISSDDNSELWLSPSADPAGRQRLCAVSDWTNPREWNKYASQRSAPVTLTAGQKYYIEVLQKEGSGGDNLAVGWLKPGASGAAPQEIVPGSALSPYNGPAMQSALRAPDNPKNVVGGLRYAYYEGDWQSLPAFNSLTPISTGTLANFALVPRRQENFAFVYTGYVTAPADGMYTFSTTSDDGSRLFIGNTLVADNDGLHPAQEVSGTIGLKAGQHAIRVEFFQRGGGYLLEVRYAGPGTPKQLIPDAALFRP